eukprot:30862-Pelagococcus_subviridis.AAC.1
MAVGRGGALLSGSFAEPRARNARESRMGCCASRRVRRRRRSEDGDERRGRGGSKRSLIFFIGQRGVM